MHTIHQKPPFTEAFFMVEHNANMPIVMTDKKIKVAIQGYEGSFHQVAAEGYYNKEIDIVPCRSFSELVVKAGKESISDTAIMAIENSIAGSILSNYNLLQESKLSVVGEVYLQISQNLMAQPGQTIDDITEVRSHPMAILQCRHFFRQHPHIKLVETEDTALSARHISENKEEGVAAIAAERAAELFQLEIIAPHIETVHNNYTRFIILDRLANQLKPGHNKASLYFGVSHEPGSLAKALQKVADEGVNLTKIQSFPVIEKEWHYYFHLDIEFNSQYAFEAAMEGLKAHTEKLRVLGIYRKGDTL